MLGESMNRRRFLHSLSASVAGAGLPLAAAARTRLDRIGLELYAVRDAMRRDPERTLAAIRQIGYTDVELLWSFKNFDRTPQQVRASLDREGLKAPSAHMAPETILTDWDQSLETAKLLGHEYLIVPTLPSDTARSLDRWRYWADQFNTAGAVARKAGIWLAFHNEPNHMQPIDGVVPYDVFVDRTDASVVRQQLDVGNMVMGGGDPTRYLAEVPRPLLELPRQGRRRRPDQGHGARDRRRRHQGPAECNPRRHGEDDLGRAGGWEPTRSSARG